MNAISPTLSAARPWRRESLAWFCIALAALVAIAPALILGQPHTDSGEYDQVWTAQFAEGLANGEIYPRWLPHSFQGFGAPTFYFYPPLTFYLSSLLHLAGVPLEPAVTWTEGVLAFGAGAAMLAWLRHRGVANPTLWAAAYALAPYHMIDLHDRGDMAELGAFVWLPLIALAIERARWRLLAFSYAGLICTHLPMALLASLFLIAPMALAERKSLMSSALGCVAGILISSIYLLPALTLQRFISTALLWEDFYRPASWSILHPAANVTALYLYTFTAAAVAAVVPLWLARPRQRWIWIACVTALAGLGVAPIWSLPALRDVQFPWRVFGIFEFVVITALAEWRTDRWRPLAILGGALALAPAFAHAVAVGALTYKAHPSATAIAAFQDGPEYLPPASGVASVDEHHRIVDRAQIHGAPVKDAIAEAARPVMALGWTLSLLAAAATLGSGWRRPARSSPS